MVCATTRVMEGGERWNALALIVMDIGLVVLVTIVLFVVRTKVSSTHVAASARATARVAIMVSCKMIVVVSVMGSGVVRCVIAVISIVVMVLSTRTCVLASVTGSTQESSVTSVSISVMVVVFLMSQNVFVINVIHPTMVMTVNLNAIRHVCTAVYSTAPHALVRSVCYRGWGLNVARVS